MKNEIYVQRTRGRRQGGACIASDQVCNNAVRIRGASTRGQVIAWTRPIVGRSSAASRGYVVEIGTRHAVNQGQGLGCPIQGPQAYQSSALVGNGNESGPLRRRVAGAAKLRPRCVGAVVVRIVNREAGVR